MVYLALQHKHQQDKEQERPKFLDEIGRHRMWRNFVVVLLCIYLHCDVQIAGSAQWHCIVYFSFIFVIYILGAASWRKNDGDNVYFWLLNVNSSTFETRRLREVLWYLCSIFLLYCESTNLSFYRAFLLFILLSLYVFYVSHFMCCHLT